jgi:nicotinate-nucleotide adenylyltransferase
MSHYAVYGGSFNPIHYGHLSMIERAIGQGYEVLVVPAYRHAFGKQSVPFAHRVRMCALALRALALDEHARVCTIEQTLAQDGDRPVYTYDVLCRLRERLQTAPCLLVGPDIAGEWERWHQHEAIDRDFGRLCLPMIRDVRSTDIRQRLEAGASPHELRDMMPAAVIDYIEQQGLYRP